MTNIDPDPSVIYGLLLQASNKPLLIPYIIAILVLLFLSALVSGSEVAYFSLNKSDIEKEEGKYTRVLTLLNQPKRLLATILILNNLINIGIVTLMSYTTFMLFGSEDSQTGFIVAAITFTTTFIIVFFGEVLPKVYANQNNLIFAKRVSAFLTIFNIIFKPFSWFLITFTNLVENSFDKKGQTFSKKELTKAIDITTEENISKEEKDILKGIVNFGQISAKQIMCSRIDVSAFDIEMDFHELMDRINKLGYSRYPVYEETVDNIKGLLYIKDLLAHVGNDEHFNWQELIRDAFFIPESKMIDDLLKDFQQMRMHMAIVVDEYGGTSGIVTLEDVIEEIVGEINDEFDDEGINYTQIDEKSFVFEGKTLIHDLCKILDLENEYFDEVKGESESLGGLMLELFSKIPIVGDQIGFQNYKFTVQAVTTKRVKRIKVETVEKELTNDAA